MSNDASAAAASPMTNGTPHTASHREADASTTSNPPPPAQSLRDVCADLHQRVENFLNAHAGDEIVRETQEQTRIAIQVIEKALQDYDFDALSLSYNGGKDCLVLLILYLAVLHSHYTSPTGRRKQNLPDHSTTTNNNSHPSISDPNSDFPTTIPSIYAKPPDPFPTVTSFVESSSATYHLSLTHISTNPGTKPTPTKARSHTSPPSTPEKQQQQQPQTQPPTDSSNAQITPNEPSTTSTSGEIITFRDAFALYLHSRPSTRAIFVGTRRTDPHGAHLTHFTPTDGSWPSFMRIHPVIDWHLSHIWTFLRSPHLAAPGNDTLEYCSMYDDGYTSLGGVGDTLRNPRLRGFDGEGRERYEPAYTLTEDEEERLGRE